MQVICCVTLCEENTFRIKFVLKQSAKVRVDNAIKISNVLGENLVSMAWQPALMLE